MVVANHSPSDQDRAISGEPVNDGLTESTAPKSAGSGAVPDFFTLLGFEESMRIDEENLAQRWKARVAQVHPDRFAAASAAEKRVAMQWSAQLNEAYQTLRDPLKRARYLCSLHGFVIGEGTGNALDMTFLEQQMQWRESLETWRQSYRDQAIDSEHAARDIELLSQNVALARHNCMERTEQMIDAKCWPQAVAAIQQWLFIDKFIQEIARARNAIA